MTVQPADEQDRRKERGAGRHRQRGNYRAADDLRTNDGDAILHELLASLREGVVITDSDYRITRGNKAFTAITGYAVDEVVGRHAACLSADRSLVSAFPVRANICKARETWGRRKDGVAFPACLSISGVSDAAGRVIHRIIVFSDLTEDRKRERHIRRLDHHDGLTDLPNHTLMLDRLKMALAAAERENGVVAVVVIDLDHFKTINDSLGHAVGDEVLRVTARRIADAVRAADTASRRGGDEFIVVLTHLRTADDAATVADNLLRTVAQPIVLGDHRLSVTPSIGIALYPDNHGEAEGLIRCADAAMYHAKELGRNNHQYFTPAMNTRAQERLALEAAMRNGIVRGEFTLHYQPQVRIEDGALAGVEALLRWQPAGGEAIPPAKFIPVAEDCGFILALGDWVLREACRQRKCWTDMGLPAFAVAVNCSAIQFRQQSFKDNVLAVATEYGLEAGALELELTESIMMHSPENAGSIVRELREAGIGVAIDDFGTGYSSLAYLKRLPVGRLKIDASFIGQLATDATDHAIVRTIIDLGRSLKLGLVAEGVENAALLEILRGLGCTAVQGYHICRPVPAWELERWLAGQAAGQA